MDLQKILATDEPYFKEGVKQVARKLGFKSYTMNIDNGVRDGVNYLGEIHRFSIEGSINGEIRKIYFIGKVITKDEKKRKVLPLNKLAKTECNIYNYMFPVLDSLQDKFGVAEKFFHPISHLATAKDYEELILMDDLSKLDPPFGLPKNGKTLDYNHAKLILETLGHYHALSFALKKYNSDLFEELIKVTAEDQLNTKINITLPQIVKNTYDAGIKRYTEAKNILDGFMENICEKSDKLLEETDEHSIICHGDVWSFNLLYSYKDNIPIKVILLDWQTIKHSSPVLDLLFCFFICLDEQTRKNHLHSFLTIYYDSLKHHLVELQCDPDKTYSEKVFRSHIKKYMPLVILHSLMMLPVFMVEKFDIDSIAEADQDELVIPNFEYPDMFHSRFQQMAKDIERLLSM